MVFFPLLNDFRPAGRLMGISIAANRKRPDSLSKVDGVRGLSKEDLKRWGMLKVAYCRKI